MGETINRGVSFHRLIRSTSIVSPAHGTSQPPHFPSRVVLVARGEKYRRPPDFPQSTRGKIPLRGRPRFRQGSPPSVPAHAPFLYAENAADRAYLGARRGDSLAQRSCWSWPKSRHQPANHSPGSGCCDAAPSLPPVGRRGLNAAFYGTGTRVLSRRHVFGCF